MKPTIVGALTGALITGTFGFFSWNPQAIAGLSHWGETLTSVMPGLILGAVVGFIIGLVNRF